MIKKIQNKNWFFIIIYFCFVHTLFAFDSSSTTFQIHAGDVESIVAPSTSTSFGLHGAGGQIATGESSIIKKISSGVLYWFYSFFAVQYEQIHYRWRADDGTEITASFPVNEDTQYVSFPKDTNKRLRFEISNEGWTDGASITPTLEVAETATCSSGTYSAVPATYGSAWVIATSTNVTDGEVTTNVLSGLTDENTNFTAGQVKDEGNTTGAITLSSAAFTEVEYNVLATSVATNGASYCFRLTNNGSTTSFVYTQYAMATVASGLSPTGSLESSVFDTFVTTGADQGPAYNSIMWSGTEGTGKVRFQLATSDCANGATNYPTCDTGTWSFFGSDDDGVTCGSNFYYDTLTSGEGGGPGKPVELSCSVSQNQNNKRYFRYKIQLCSSNCSASGVTSPVVSGVVVNWAP